MMLNAMVAVSQASTDWREFAGCRSAEPELFFPVSAAGQSLDQAERAKAVCAVCTVRRECLQFALATRQDYGVWGGMSEQERHQDRTASLRPVAPG
jgi:WhiB family transcriptional regulator, redox-sensing transcriptional regulator